LHYTASGIITPIDVRCEVPAQRAQCLQEFMISYMITSYISVYGRHYILNKTVYLLASAL